MTRLLIAVFIDGIFVGQDLVGFEGGDTELREFITTRQTWETMGQFFSEEFVYGFLHFLREFLIPFLGVPDFVMYAPGFVNHLPRVTVTSLVGVIEIVGIKAFSPLPGIIIALFVICSRAGCATPCQKDTCG